MCGLQLDFLVSSRISNLSLHHQCLLKAAFVIAIASFLVGCQTDSNLDQTYEKVEVEWEVYVRQSPSPIKTQRRSWMDVDGKSSSKPQSVRSNADPNRKPVPTANERMHYGVSANPNVSLKSGSDWMNDHVPLGFQSDLMGALSTAHRVNQAFIDDPSDNRRYVLSAFQAVDNCSKIEILIMSEGGKLPIISRGQIEVCS